MAGLIIGRSEGLRKRVVAERRFKFQGGRVVSGWETSLDIYVDAVL
jgi:hypothetical protein